MPPYVLLEKNVGETPLQALDRLRVSSPEYRDVPLAYAGRLDPMASGQLLVLVGEECKNREKYLGLDKEYEFEVLFGFESDTGDVLGMVTRAGVLDNYSDDQCREAGMSIIGAHELPYPNFSSKTVDGKPLFQYALEGTLSSISIPTSPMVVSSVEYLGTQRRSGENVITQILQNIERFSPPIDPARFGSDFRKAEILAQWNTLRHELSAMPCVIAKYRVHVSAGTYIRALVPLIAQQLGTKGLAYSIHRTKVCL